MAAGLCPSSSFSYMEWTMTLETLHKKARFPLMGRFIVHVNVSGPLGFAKMLT